MSLYSTILSSNNAGSRSVVEEWLKDQQFFMGADKQDVIIDINDDSSISIKSLQIHNSKNSDSGYFTPFLEISIHKLPPFGIKEVSGFDKVQFINIAGSDSKLPTIFKKCIEIDFSYCIVGKEYINNIQENLKKNSSHWGHYTKVMLEHTTLV